MIVACAICGETMESKKSKEHARETGHDHFRPYFEGVSRGGKRI